MDMSDPTAINLCFGCGASWTGEIEGRCPDCGEALVSRERILAEFEGSLRKPDASLPDMSSLDLLCTTTDEVEQSHQRNRLEELGVPYFCFREEQKPAGDGSPVPSTSFYIADLQLEWARDRLADAFGDSVLIARAANEFEAGIYRAALDDRGIRYTTSRLTQYPVVAVGPLAETLFFVAEADIGAARRAIEDVGDAEASGEQDVPGGDALSTDDAGPDRQESSASTTTGDGVSGDESRLSQDLRDQRAYRMTRFFLFISAAMNLLLSATLGLFLQSSHIQTAVPIGLLCFITGAVLAWLALWSRRNPEAAFGCSLFLLIVYHIVTMPTVGLFSLFWELVPMDDSRCSVQLEASPGATARRS
ncbi:MAG TPA: CPBP family intramembrane glutamic endopeptidase [Candidatus Polarisedimenticolia bacterium]|jgi:hypothetical protein|nr:CPBP family intramembrane glutamic endopeptidase [Candidatus Polarisedimenticolia bacterium]